MALALTKLSLTLLLLLAGCGTAAGEPADTADLSTVPPPSSTLLNPPAEVPEDVVADPEGDAVPMVPDPRDDAGSGQPADDVPVPPEQEPEPNGQQPGGEVPGVLLAEIISDAAARLGVDPAGFAVIRAESIVWNDGSLGCPEPGVMYTQATVPGYWIVLQHDATEIDYRTSGVSFYTPCSARAEPGTDELPGRCANC